MKLVGDGMAKYYQRDDLKLLGISSWECGMFRDELVSFYLLFISHYQSMIKKT